MVFLEMRREAMEEEVGEEVEEDAQRGTLRIDRLWEVLEADPLVGSSPQHRQAMLQ